MFSKYVYDKAKLNGASDKAAREQAQNPALCALFPSGNDHVHLWQPTHLVEYDAEGKLVITGT